MKLICPECRHETEMKPGELKLGVFALGRVRELEDLLRAVPFPLEYEHDGFVLKWSPPKEGPTDGTPKEER